MAIVLGVGFAVWQLRQSARDRDLEALSAIFERLHDAETYARHARLNAALARGHDSLEPEDRLDATITIDFFQRMGFLAHHRLVDRRLVLMMYSGLILEMWKSLEPVVQQTRRSRDLANYAAEFELLAWSAGNHRSRNYSPLRYRKTRNGRTG